MNSTYELEIHLNYVVGERLAEATRERLILQARRPRAAPPGAQLGKLVGSIMRLRPSAYGPRALCQHSG